MNKKNTHICTYIKYIIFINITNLWTPVNTETKKQSKQQVYFVGYIVDKIVPVPTKMYKTNNERKE